MRTTMTPPTARPKDTVAIRPQAIREAAKNRPDGYLEEIDGLKHESSNEQWWYIGKADYERLREKYRNITDHRTPECDHPMSNNGFRNFCKKCVPESTPQASE